jgi:hypothetical protein
VTNGTVVIHWLVLVGIGVLGCVPAKPNAQPTGEFAIAIKVGSIMDNAVRDQLTLEQLDLRLAVAPRDSLGKGESLRYRIGRTLSSEVSAIRGFFVVTQNGVVVANGFMGNWATPGIPVWNSQEIDLTAATLHGRDLQKGTLRDVLTGDATLVRYYLGKMR